MFHNVSFVTASCEEQSESIKNHYNLQFFYFQILNERQKYKRVRTILSFDFELVGFQVIGKGVHFFCKSLIDSLVRRQGSFKGISKQKMIVLFTYEEPVRAMTFEILTRLLLKKCLISILRENCLLQIPLENCALVFDISEFNH